MKLLYWIPAILYAAMIFGLSHESHPPGAQLGPDYLLHFLEYGLFALTVVIGLTGGFRESLDSKRALLAWFLAAFYGLVDEIHQYFVPERFASVQDWVADSLGAAVVVALCFFVLSRRKGGEG